MQNLAMIKEPMVRSDPLPGGHNKSQVLKQEFIVIHALSASGIAPDDPYNYALIRKIMIDYGVAAHDLIRRSGEIVEWVDPHLVAWHAGRSQFRGRARNNTINYYALGIELEGQQDVDFTDEQYRSLAWRCAQYAQAFGIPTKNIVGHSDVSNYEVRKDPKWDPGRGFDWILFGHLFMQERMKQ